MSAEQAQQVVGLLQEISPYVEELFKTCAIVACVNTLILAAVCAVALVFFLFRGKWR